MVTLRISNVFLVLLLSCYLSECHDPFSYQFVKRDHFNDFFEDEGSRWLCLALGFCSAFFSQKTFAQKSPSPLSVLYQWSQLEFDYGSPAYQRDIDISSQTFIPGKPAPIDVDVHYGEDNGRTVFVTIPRFQAGVPATLGTLSDRTYNGNPLILPFPSWDWHRNPERCGPHRLVSVYRVQIDECGRLWVLDTGRLLENQTCPAQILAFNVGTKKLLYQYAIPSDQIESRSILVTPVVDVRDAHSKCRDTFVYIADCQTYSIIVVDVRNNRSWRVTDKTMYPYPTYGTFSILGDSFDLMDGVLGMALEPYQPGQDRRLFYHAMSSPTENWVYTSQLRNESRFLHDPSSSPEIFHTFRGERRTQSAAEAIDKDGNMYFGLMSDVTVNCWDTAKEYGGNHLSVIANNRETLQFASGVKVITNPKGLQELWLMTSRFQKIATDSLSSNEVNFRIHAAKIEDLIQNSNCKRGHRNPVNHGHHNTHHQRPGQTNQNGYGFASASASADASSTGRYTTNYRQ